LLFVLTAIPAGCIFSPHKDDGKVIIVPPDYPKLENPFSVLDALELAYAAKDSNEIKLLYDDQNYQGTSFDPVNQNQIPLTWSDEVRHVARLAQTPAITGIKLTFPPAKVRETDLLDPPGWAMIKIQNMTLELTDNSTNTFFHLVSSDNFEYHFIPHTPDASSTTDTTWKIVRWTEFQN